MEDDTGLRYKLAPYERRALDRMLNGAEDVRDPEDDRQHNQALAERLMALGHIEQLRRYPPMFRLTESTARLLPILTCHSPMRLLSEALGDLGPGELRIRREGARGWSVQYRFDDASQRTRETMSDHGGLTRLIDRLLRSLETDAEQ